ncbi:MAG: helix-turn-helix domain-containing protein [Acutalibacteraceae bacterium]
MKNTTLNKTFGFHNERIKFHMKFSHKSSKGNDYVEYSENCNYYKILYIMNENFSFSCENNITHVKSGDMILTMPFEDFSLYGNIKSENNPKIISISIHPTVFNSVHGNIDFMRVFTNRKKGENNCYKSEKLREVFDFGYMIKNMMSYVDYNLDEIHFISAIGVIITNLTMIYDKEHNDSQNHSNEYEVKIYDYICQNFCNNVSINEICEKFSVSPWYVNKATLKFYGRTFKDTVNSLRMWHAYKLIESGTEIKEVSQLCGFANYSGFFKCFKKFFFITPSEMQLRLLKKDK